MIWLIVGFVIYYLVLAIGYAKIEIAIEGKYGFGEKLPCKKWKLKGILNKIIGERPYFSEYHLWMIVFLILIFHLPIWILAFFATGCSFLTVELFILGLYFIFLITEDFLWFVLNPDYGLKKFKPEHIWWHPKWIMKVPSIYWYLGPLGLMLIGLALIILSRTI